MDDQELPIPDVVDAAVPTDQQGDTAPLALPYIAPVESPINEEPEPGALPEGASARTNSTMVPAQPESSPLETAREVFREGDPKPFVVTLYQTAESRGHFRPAATVAIAQALRTTGLLVALPPEELKTLVALLTFLSPNGDIRPTAPEVAEALAISDVKAEDRLQRLARFRWQAKPLVATLWRETGLDGYALTHHAVAYQEGVGHSRTSNAGVQATAGREAVMARTRATYARPRSEVERQIAMAQGWPLPDGSTVNTGPQASGISSEEYLRQRLLRLGVTPEQIELLLATFPTETIEAQMAWLPYRGAKNPASYLVAAITGNYSEPAILTRRRELQEEPGADAAAHPSNAAGP